MSYLERNYTIIAKDDNIAIMIPSDHYPPKTDQNDYAVILNTKTMRYYETVSCLPITIMREGISKKQLINSVRRWSYEHDLFDKNKIDNFDNSLL